MLRSTVTASGPTPIPGSGPVRYRELGSYDGAYSKTTLAVEPAKSVESKWWITVTF